MSAEKDNSKVPPDRSQEPAPIVGHASQVGESTALDLDPRSDETPRNDDDREINRFNRLPIRHSPPKRR
ncbi:MAG TPA: hypothetical protein VGO43_06015 [Pyrinomonadaceae bacterium]|jgi:hypothetical protein|nr:hypothetical protein [Pyrinomonadaceae bacterium]